MKLKLLMGYGSPAIKFEHISKELKNHEIEEDCEDEEDNILKSFKTNEILDLQFLIKHSSGIPDYMFKQTLEYYKIDYLWCPRMCEDEIIINMYRVNKDQYGIIRRWLNGNHVNYTIAEDKALIDNKI